MPELKNPSLTNHLGNLNTAGIFPAPLELSKVQVLDPEVLEAFEIMGMDPYATPGPRRSLAEIEEGVAEKLLALNQRKGIVLYGNEFPLED